MAILFTEHRLFDLTGGITGYFIKEDLARFTNAVNSRNFAELINTERELLAVGEEIDSLFLNFNVDGKALSEIKGKLYDIRYQIQKVKIDSQKIDLEKLIDIEESIEQDNLDEIDDMLERSGL